jgi:hypothetical protein
MAAVAPFEVTGDAIERPLGGRIGDAVRGRAVTGEVVLTWVDDTGEVAVERRLLTVTPA